jgi:hypothetical protein
LIWRNRTYQIACGARWPVVGIYRLVMCIITIVSCFNWLNKRVIKNSQSSKKKNLGDLKLNAVKCSGGHSNRIRWGKETAKNSSDSMHREIASGNNSCNLQAIHWKLWYTLCTQTHSYNLWAIRRMLQYTLCTQTCSYITRGQSARCYSIIHSVLNLVHITRGQSAGCYSIHSVLKLVHITHGQSAGCYSIHSVLKLVHITRGQSTGCYSIHSVLVHITRGQSAGCYSIHSVLKLVHITLGQSTRCYSIHSVLKLILHILQTILITPL